MNDGLFSDINNDTSQSSVHSHISSEKINCGGGTTMDIYLKDNLKSDCIPEGRDNQTLKELLDKKIPQTCIQTYQIPCMEGHPKCYNLTDIYIYKLNFYQHIFPCRNGGHLQKCTSFQYNLMYKCIVSCCIPWSYVCDRK